MLTVAPDRQDLEYEDGYPFFWLGTRMGTFTGWTIPEITTYLNNRAARGFNVIQAVALAEFDGLHTPNRYGELPLLQDDFSRPNEKYFS